jgi:hypothetical protein
MNILVKFQPDIPILMAMGGRLTPYGPKLGYPWEAIETGGNYYAQLQTPNPEIIMDNPQRKLALGEVHNPCRYYI